MINIATIIVTFVITALSFAGGVLLGSSAPTKKIIKQIKRKLQKDQTGGVRSLTPKEDRLNKDREFRKQFPEIYGH